MNRCKNTCDIEQDQPLTNYRFSVLATIALIYMLYSIVTVTIN